MREQLEQEERELRAQREAEWVCSKVYFHSMHLDLHLIRDLQRAGLEVLGQRRLESAHMCVRWNLSWNAISCASEYGLFILDRKKSEWQGESSKIPILGWYDTYSCTIPRKLLDRYLAVSFQLTAFSQLSGCYFSTLFQFWTQKSLLALGKPPPMLGPAFNAVHSCKTLVLAYRTVATSHAHTEVFSWKCDGFEWTFTLL